MISLSERILNMNEPETLAMSRLARELQAKGKNVINLSLGEPDFNTPDFIKEAAIQAIYDNYSKYPPVAGYLDVREAICEKFYRDNQLQFTPENIVISTGAKQSIANVCLSILNPGDEVILPAPYWVTYREIVKLCGAVPVVIQATAEQNFKISHIQLQEKITPKTKLILYSSPSNPTGAVYSKDELNKIASVIIKHPNILVISDEIYEHIQFSEKHVSIASISGMKEKTIVVNGVSKAFAMTGWRIGYIAAPKYIADACSNIQGQFTSGANTIAQKATKTAVLADPIKIKPMIEAFRERRNFIIQSLQKLPNIYTPIPDGAFYVFPDISKYLGSKYSDTNILTSKDLSMFLLHDALVSTVPGEAFEAPNNIRISYAANIQDIETAIQRISVSLQKLTF